MDDQPDPKLLESVDEGRRASLKKILLGSAFAIPVIASFTMTGLGTAEAGRVGQGNGTTVGKGDKGHRRHHGHDHCDRDYKHHKHHEE